MRKAARSFPADTGLGADNVAPRAIARLSDQAILALIALLEAFEASGSWCDALDLVLIVLLPKSDGGRRPIGLLCTIIRIWMRVRSDILREWEREQAHGSVFAGCDMGAQRAAWCTAFTAEAAALNGDEHGLSLMDLVKAFETVPHHMLVEAAKLRGYPLRLLRLSLQAYRLQRVVGIDGAYSKRIRATRGTTAGSGSATTELKALLLDLVGRGWTWLPPALFQPLTNLTEPRRPDAMVAHHTRPHKPWQITSLSQT